LIIIFLVPSLWLGTALGGSASSFYNYSCYNYIRPATSLCPIVRQGAIARQVPEAILMEVVSMAKVDIIQAQAHLAELLTRMGDSGERM